MTIAMYHMWGQGVVRRSGHNNRLFAIVTRCSDLDDLRNFQWVYND